MTWTIRRRCRAQALAPLFLLLVVGGATACGDPLEVDDPTAILDSDLNNAEGAELLRRDALRALYRTAGNSAWESGLFADEFRFQLPAGRAPGTLADEVLDWRDGVTYEQLFDNVSYTDWQRLWGRAGAVAIAKLQAYAPPGARPYVGEVFAMRGFAAMRLAEYYCPGFPLHDIVDFAPVYGPPLTTEQAFERALAAFDSAVAWAGDSTRILNFARVGRARVLLNLGRFAEAASAAAAVPTAAVYQTEYTNSTAISFLDAFTNPLFLGSTAWGSSRSVGDREGGTGLNFASTADPRVPTTLKGKARDSTTNMYALAKYPTQTTPIVLTSGIEARLIEAEAALRAGDVPTWLAKLNEPRRTAISPALADLTDPGTEAARVDLLFRERAFWLFGTGSRLGDLRRLIRQYNRPSESVFPTGPYWQGGSYATGTSIPFHKDERLSPGVTGCTSR